jgi:putative ABC transport system permease protein
MRILLKLLRRYLAQRPGRTLMTIGGVASALLLFVCVESLAAGLNRALASGASARTLIVYRKNRYCPQTSFLPERYTSLIEGVPGVRTVLPIKVFLSNCRASLDQISFQGAPVDRLLQSRSIELLEGDLDRFRREAKSALVGRVFAARRGLRPGHSFRFGSIAVDVAGVFGSQEAVEESLVLTHLEFLQRAGPVSRLGTVTQFEVKIDDPSHARRIANEIDTLFQSAEEPTDTRARVQFLEDATRELRELLAFGRAFGIICVLVVLALVANTVLMAVRERQRQLGVFLTLGFTGRHLLVLVVAEALALTLSGAALGLCAAFLLLRFSRLAVGVEGITVPFVMAPQVFLLGSSIAVATAMVAAAWPAWRASRADVQTLLRTA